MNTTTQDSLPQEVVMHIDGDITTSLHNPSILINQLGGLGNLIKYASRVPIIK